MEDNISHKNRKTGRTYNEYGDYDNSADDNQSLHLNPANGIISEPIKGRRLVVFEEISSENRSEENR